MKFWLSLERWFGVFGPACRLWAIPEKGVFVFLLLGKFSEVIEAMPTSPKVFVASHDYESTSAEQLSFKMRDEIEIQEEAGDWWWGRLVRTGEEGWFAPGWGKVKKAVDPSVPPSAALLNDQMKAESKFLKKLKSQQ